MWDRPVGTLEGPVLKLQLQDTVYYNKTASSAVMDNIPQLLIFEPVLKLHTEGVKEKCRIIAFYQ